MRYEIAARNTSFSRGRSEWTEPSNFARRRLRPLPPRKLTASPRFGRGVTQVTSTIDEYRLAGNELGAFEEPDDRIGNTLR